MHHTLQGHPVIPSGLQHDHAVRRHSLHDQRVPARSGRPLHQPRYLSANLPDQGVAVVHRFHPGLRRHVQQGVEGAPAHHQGQK